jgi:hypothetical protein
MTRTEQIAIQAFRRSPAANLLLGLFVRLEAEAQARYEAEPASDVNRGYLMGLRAIRALMFTAPTNAAPPQP